MKSKICSVPVAILVVSLFLVSCAQPTEQVIETGNVSKFSQLDQDFCTAFLEQINPESAGEDRSQLRLVAANHWVVVDDEILMMSLRDLHNMNFDRYQIIAADVFIDSPDVGATDGRSEFAIEQEYRLKRSSIINRCLKITDDPRLDILGSAK
jgi:hypothetical protein